MPLIAVAKLRYRQDFYATGPVAADGVFLARSPHDPLTSNGNVGSPVRAPSAASLTIQFLVAGAEAPTIVIESQL